jgi:transposase
MKERKERQARRPERGTLPYSRWCRQNEEYVCREFRNRPTEEIARECGLSYRTVARIASQNGVRKSGEFMRSRFASGGRSGNWKRCKRTEDWDAYMKEHFPDTGNTELAAHFGVDVKTVRRWARRLGLQKSEAFMNGSRLKGKVFYKQEYKERRDARIAEVYPDGDDEALRRLADELGISVTSVGRMARKIGIYRSEEGRKKSCGRNRKYPVEMIEALREYYPCHSNRECEEMFGVKASVLAALAHANGIGKDKAYITRMRGLVAKKRKRG